MLHISCPFSCLKYAVVSQRTDRQGNRFGNKDIPHQYRLDCEENSGRNALRGWLLPLSVFPATNRHVSYWLSEFCRKFIKAWFFENATDFQINAKYFHESTKRLTFASHAFTLCCQAERHSRNVEGEDTKCHKLPPHRISIALQGIPLYFAGKTEYQH